MEALLAFLANAIVNATIGHYVGKGLSKIDPDLPALLKETDSLDAAEQLVVEKGLEDQISRFAKKTFDNSIILPVLTAENVTNRDKTELFLNFLNIGMRLSQKLKIDLVLPSSFITANSFTIFSDNVGDMHELEMSGVAVDLSAGGVLHHSVFIVPIESEDMKSKRWEKYLETIVELREETEGYLNLRDLSPYLEREKEYCAITKITAGACYFPYTNLMHSFFSEQLAIVTGKAKMRNWHSSIKEMTGGMAEILKTQSLPEDEIEKMRESYADIQHILDSHLKNA